MIATLDWRAAVAHASHDDVQFLSWLLQSGAKYPELPNQSHRLVDWLIPDFKSQLAESIDEKIERAYNASAGKLPSAPSFDGALSRLGPVGDAVISMRTLRTELISAGSSTAALRARLVPPSGVAQHAPTPWSRIADRVYERFTTNGNFATPGRLDIRVLTPRTSSAPYLLAMNGATDVALIPHIVHLPVPITGVFGNPHDSGIQPLAMGAAGGGLPPWKITVPNRDGKPGGWKEVRTVGVFMHDGRAVVCSVTVGIPIVSSFGINTDAAASEALEIYLGVAGQETTAWLNASGGDFMSQEEICAHFRALLQEHMQGSFPGARVTR